MATTIDRLATGGAQAGRRGGNRRRRFGLGATLAAGVATLGCAAALTFGGVGGEQAARARQQAAYVQAPYLSGTDDFNASSCVGSAGPFACASTLAVATVGTDDLATNVCIGTVGPFACPAADAARP